MIWVIAACHQRTYTTPMEFPVDRPEKPLNAAVFVLAGVLAGLVGGVVGGLASWSVIGANNDFLRWLHPSISGSTDYFLGLFLFNVMVLPVLLAALGGIILPAGYSLAKAKGWASMSRRNWLIGMSLLVIVLLVLALYGPEKWYVLVAAELPVALGLTAALTVMLISLFNEQLRKLG